MADTRRRRFLERSAALAIAAAVGGTAGCREEPPAPLRSESGRETLALIVGEPLAHALQLASLAPSSHNMQPWRVEICEPQRWEIGLSSARRLPAVDPGNREPLLSLGAFLENLLLAAEAGGWRGDWRVVATQPTDPVVLEVEWTRAPPRPYPLSRLSERRTLRSGYRNRVLSDDDFAFLAVDVADCRYLPAGSSSAGYLAENTIAAMREQSLRDAAQQELADWIRWSPAMQRRHRDGLTPASMEIEGIAGWYVSHFYSPAKVLTDGFRAAGVERAQEQARAGAGWIVMTSTDASVANLIDSGRRFERLALRARDRGIALQPMTQMLEESPWRDKVARALDASGHVQWIVRVGYVDRYTAPVSPRLPLTAFVRVSSPRQWTSAAAAP